MPSGVRRTKNGFLRLINSTVTSGKSYPNCLKGGNQFLTKDRQLNQKSLLLDDPTMSAENQQVTGVEK